MNPLERQVKLMEIRKKLIFPDDSKQFEIFRIDKEIGTKNDFLTRTIIKNNKKLHFSTFVPLSNILSEIILDNSLMVDFSLCRCLLYSTEITKKFPTIYFNEFMSTKQNPSTNLIKQKILEFLKES